MYRIDRRTIEEKDIGNPIEMNAWYSTVSGFQQTNSDCASVLRLFIHDRGPELIKD